jgi:LuxR family maltose regulon positive regulatory protein
VIWAQVLQPLIQQAQGQTAPALASLGRALTLAEPEGYVRVFLDEGAPMAELLAQVARHRAPAAEYAARLLAAFPDELRIENEQLSSSSTTNSQFSILNSQFLVEPLTGRELEVLRLLAEGRDNAEIARALVVAVSTIKSHVNHIFSKLGVSNRLEAELRARQLNLL